MHVLVVKLAQIGAVVVVVKDRVVGQTRRHLHGQEARHLPPIFAARRPYAAAHSRRQRHATRKGAPRVLRAHAGGADTRGTTETGAHLVLDGVTVPRR